jgi:lipopolysaccharide/colanic/teichoic acid biosynthesis glycosyltransferase
MSVRSAYCRKHGIGNAPRWAPYRSFEKRLLDLAIAVPALLLVSPVLLLAAILIKLDSRGPVMFVQQRLGRYGSTFPTFKFRSMTHRDRAPNSEILPGHSEVTRVGAWLRRTKIDELPQLLNIVRGDMSIVGPRPALPDHIRKYNDNGNGLRRLLVRPGLTGLAQTSGNIYLSWPERWHYDANYVAQLSLLSDLRIMVKTIAVVLLGEKRFIRHVDIDSAPSRLDERAVDRRAA